MRPRSDNNDAEQLNKRQKIQDVENEISTQGTNIPIASESSRTLSTIVIHYADEENYHKNVDTVRRKLQGLKSVASIVQSIRKLTSVITLSKQVQASDITYIFNFLSSQANPVKVEKIYQDVLTQQTHKILAVKIPENDYVKIVDAMRGHLMREFGHVIHQQKQNAAYSCFLIYFEENAKAEDITGIVFYLSNFSKYSKTFNFEWIADVDTYFSKFTTQIKSKIETSLVKYDLILRFNNNNHYNKENNAVYLFIKKRFSNLTIKRIAEENLMLFNIGINVEELRNCLETVVKYLNKKNIEYTFQNAIVTHLQQLNLPSTNVKASNNLDNEIDYLKNPRALVFSYTSTISDNDRENIHIEFMGQFFAFIKQVKDSSSNSTTYIFKENIVWKDIEPILAYLKSTRIAEKIENTRWLYDENALLPANVTVERSATTSIAETPLSRSPFTLWEPLPEIENQTSIAVNDQKLLDDFFADVNNEAKKNNNS